MRWLAALALASALTVGLAACDSGPKADPENAAQVERGRVFYEVRCAQCHGIRLEGQPNWQVRNVNGLLPAPPHDETGHTWHHPDALLFQITKAGGQSIAPPDFKSGMPAFGEVMRDDDIWDVLAFIKSKWPPHIRETQARRNP